MFLVACLSPTANAELPDGTLVFSHKKGIVGRVARRMTGGDRYTHVAIVFDGYVYESDWPRSKKTPIAQYGKRGSTNDFYVPTEIKLDVAVMKATAEQSLSQPYRLRNFLRPNSRPTDGTWCSPWVGRVLSAGGRSLEPSDYRKPQTLLNRVGGSYRFQRRTTR